MSLGLEQALAVLHGAVPALTAETIPLADALQRTSAAAVYAKYDMPPFDRAAMDGYAVRSADIAEIDKKTHATLKVIDKAFAGQPASQAVTPGTAIRIMTGAMVPVNADCIVQQEKTDCGVSFVNIFNCEKMGVNICRKGEEYRAGECLLDRGIKIDAAAMACLSGNGYRELSVYRRPSAAILITGNEVVSPYAVPGPGQIFDSNAAYLQCRLQECGFQVSNPRYCRDELVDIAEQLCDAANSADIVFTVGGVSVGEKDLTPAAVREADADILFHGIDMKPGMPTMLSKRGNVPIMSLSGNPYSAAVAFELCIPVIIGAMHETELRGLHCETAILQNDYPKGGSKRRFLRGIHRGEGVCVPSQQSNGMMRSLSGCNCLVEISAGAAGASLGQRVRIIPFYKG